MLARALNQSIAAIKADKNLSDSDKDALVKQFEENAKQTADTIKETMFRATDIEKVFLTRFDAMKQELQGRNIHVDFDLGDKQSNDSKTQPKSDAKKAEAKPSTSTDKDTTAKGVDAGQEKAAETPKAAQPSEASTTTGSTTQSADTSEQPALPTTGSSKASITRKFSTKNLRSMAMSKAAIERMNQPKGKATWDALGLAGMSSVAFVGFSFLRKLKL